MFPNQSIKLKRRSGFTLIELLVVIAIIAILIALLVPAVQKVREAAARTQCVNNLKQIVLATHSYHDANNHLPWAYNDGGSGTGNKVLGQMLVSLLPYLERQGICDYMSSQAAPPGVYWLNIGGTAVANTGKGANATINIFKCPSDPSYKNGFPVNTSWAAGCYCGNYQVFGWPPAGNTQPTNSITQLTMTTISDGTSNTIFFTEKAAACATPGNTNNTQTLWAHGGWNYRWMPMFAYGSNSATAPTGYNSGCDANYVGVVGSGSMFQLASQYTIGNAPCAIPTSPHNGGINAAFGDGTVKFLAPTMDPLSVWWYLVLPQDGQPIAGEF